MGRALNEYILLGVVKSRQARLDGFAFSGVYSHEYDAQTASCRFTPRLNCYIWLDFTKSIQAASFADEIREQREKKGRPVEEAAERAGMTVEAWKAIENGHMPQTWKEVCALAEGLGESRFTLGSLVIRHAAAWGPEGDLPREVDALYS